MITNRKNKSSRFLKRKVSHDTYRKILYAKWGEHYVNYRKKWEYTTLKQQAPIFPLHIDIDTIDSCNLHCPHCCEELTASRSGIKMNIDLLDRIFNESTSYGLCSLNIGSVAEPLLEKETAFYALKRAKHIGIMEKYLHTNGILLNEGISDKLIELELNYLCISVDAADKNTYSKMRYGSFDLLKDNIINFKKMRDSRGVVFPVLRLSFLKTDRNKEQEAQFFKEWGDIGEILEVQALIDYEKPLSKLPQPISEDCYSPWQRLMVNVEGDMGLCCSKVSLKPDLIIGNIADTSIHEAWNSEKAGRIRQAHKNKDFANFPTCYQCLARIRK